MALVFIAGAIIGGLFGALLMYAYDLRILNDYKRRVNTIEKRFIGLIPDNPRVAYICDGTACDECNPDCHHIFNINHARNFECIAENEYWEKEETEDAKWPKQNVNRFNKPSFADDTHNSSGLLDED